MAEATEADKKQEKPATSPLLPVVVKPTPSAESVGSLKNLSSKTDLATWLKNISRQLHQEDADVAKLLTQGDSFMADIEKERKRLKDLEEELAYVKRGSVAVISYLRSREKKPLPKALAEEDVEKKPLSPSLLPVMEEFEMTKRKLDEKERNLAIRLEELEAKWKPIVEKEEILAKLEEELLSKEGQINIQLTQLGGEQRNHSLPEGPEPLERTRPIDDLEKAGTKKEIENQGEKEDRARKIAEERLGRREGKDPGKIQAITTLSKETENDLAKTGVPNLDNLLNGGLPIGCNVLVNGTPHSGREVMAKFFAIEGLKMKIPVLWIVTDTDPPTLRNEMAAISPRYSNYERQGLVHYVDFYSLMLGMEREDPYVTRLAIQEPHVLDKLNNIVDSLAAQFLENSNYYRVVFQSLSTIIAYLDVPTTLKFLQPFLGKRRLDKGVCYYLVETGMHSASSLDLLENMMDGAISLEVDQLKSHLSVRGLADVVQTRAKIEYTFTKKSFNLGSFSLVLIR